MLFVDIDECLTNISGCSQACTNTIGSYQCSCTDGYILLPVDNKTCQGMIILSQYWADMPILVKFERKQSFTIASYYKIISMEGPLS